ncbi:MAG: 6-bladed beta-propeller [Gemmatimonadales bacterium]|jgi:hypothetical protein
MKMTYRPGIVLLLAGALAACGGGETRWAGTMTDSAGVTIVSNPAVGIWAPGDEWTFAEEMRIGALEGEAEYQFGQVGFIALDSKDQIYVTDIQAQHIQVYAPDGSYVRTIGQRGSGPGEFLGAAFVLVGPGDTLLVPDVQNQRINRFAPDGSSLGSVRIELQQGLPILFQGTDNGVMAQQVRQFALPGQPAIENPQDAIRILAPDGTIQDTLLTFASGETFRLSGGAPQFKFYSAEPAWDINDERLLFAVNDDYRIGVYSTAGELERVITKSFERKPVAQRDKDALMTFLESAWADAGVPAEAINQLKQNVSYGESFPAFATLTTGPAGTTWVQHVQAASELSEDEYASWNPIEDTGGAEWDVFDSQGRYLGLVTMPRRFAPRVFRGEDIYGVWRDELDVQYVVKLRIIGDLGVGAT